MGTFSNRLNEAMQLRDIRAVDLVKETGISKSRISQYVNGIYEAKQTALYLLAKALNVSEAWLMGYDVPMDRANAVESTEGIAEDPFTDELYKKISLLDDEDKGKVDGFVSGLLATNKYRGEEQTYQIKIAARGGGVKEITLTESQMAAILNAPEVTDLGPDKS